MIVKGMILAAGYGTRLRPLTDFIPKPLLPVLGNPILWYQANLLRAAGVDEVVINLHHLPAQIEEYVAAGGLGPLKTTCIRELDRILGTGGGIRNARPRLEGGTFIVVNGDTLISADLSPMLDAHRRSGALATLLLREAPDAPDEHSICIDSAGRVRRMVGFGSSPEGLTRCAFLGVHVLEPGIFDYLPEEGCVIRSAYRAAAADGKLIAGVITRGVQRDIGTPAALLDANLDMIRKSLTITVPNGIKPISDHMLCCTNKVILNIKHPVFSGPGCVFAPGCELGPRAVFSGANKVEAGARVIDSLVLHGEEIHSDEVLERTIAGFGQRIKA